LRQGRQVLAVSSYDIEIANQHVLSEPTIRLKVNELTFIVQEQVYAFFHADQLDQVMVVLHSAAHGFLQSRQLIFQGVYFRFLMRADLEHSDFLLFAHKPYLRFQNWDGIVHEIFLNCKPFFAQNSCRSGALVIDYFPLKCLCQSLKISPLSLFPQVFAANTVGTP
jgi:hypothetical protein